MKVLILSVADLRHMTCCNYYFDLLSRNNIEFDVICSNRYEEKTKFFYKGGLYQIDMFIPDNASKLQKIKPFFKFKKEAMKIIHKQKYDFIIIWGENAFVLFRRLIKKYGDRVLYNMRDYLEGFMKLFDKSSKRLTRKTLISTCPSPRCLNVLEGNKHVMTNRDSFVESNYPKSKELHLNKEGKIVITYMGLVTKYSYEFERFILAFKNDDRFILRFFGTGAFSCLQKLVEDNGINNVVLGDSFSSEKTVYYLGTTDIINSVYGKSNTGVDDAVGVKESYSPLLHIPVLSDKGCHWAIVSERYGFGLGVDNDFTKAPDQIYEWYTHLDKKVFDKGCDDYCKKAYKGNEIIDTTLLNKLKEIEEKQ